MQPKACGSGLMRRLCLITLLFFGCDETSTEETEARSDAGAADQTAPTQSLDADVVDALATDTAVRQQNDAARPDATGVPIADSGAIADSQADGGYTIWTGPRVTFTKPAGADPTTAEAQDVITDNVILTRGDGNILYNIAQEMRVTPSTSPIGTLWAMGTSDAVDTLEFEPLKAAANNRMQDLPGRDMVLYLVDENIYIDVRFISWRAGRGNGGGFSYERTTASAE